MLFHRPCDLESKNQQQRHLVMAKRARPDAVWA
jgi:hypothetical protein